MQLAVAEGPNHWPGCLPQAEAPCWTKRWIEKAARGSSAKSDAMLASSYGCDWDLAGRHRQSRPSCSMTRALASRDCPDLIIHPHPVSEVKPSLSARLRSLTAKVMPEEAEGVWERGIGGNDERYVNHSRDSKSSKKAGGQPASVGSFDSVGTSLLSTCVASSKLLVFVGAEDCDSAEVDAVGASEGA